MNGSGGIVTRIKELVEAIACATKSKLITKCKNNFFLFNSDPFRHLMKYFNNEARRVVSTIINIISTSNVSHFGKLPMSINDSVIEMPVREAVRTCDKIASEINHLIDKCLQNYSLIDVEARIVFSKIVTTVELKFSAGFNMYVTRGCSINKNKFDSSYPR